MKKVNTVVKALLVIIMVLTGCLVLYALYCAPKESESYKGTFSSRELSDGWTLISGDGSRTENLSLPLDTRETEDETVLLVNTLPGDIRDGMRLYFHTRRQDARIYVNGEERGSYLAERFSSKRKTPPSAYLIIDLYDRDANGEIVIEVVSKHSYAGRYNEVRYGNGNDIWLPIISQNLTKTAVSTVLCLLGIISILTYIFARKRLSVAKTILYLGETLLVAGLWALSESPMRQLIFRAPSYSGIFAYVLIEIMAAFAIMYFDEMQKHRYTVVFNILECGILLQVCANIALNTAGIAEFYDTLVFSHVWSVLCILATIITLVLDFRSGRAKKYSVTAHGMACVAIFGTLELLDYYFSYTPHLGLFLGLGLMFLLGATALQSIIDALHNREQMAYADNANRAKSFFLANMSHEIRTPINAILGMDEMILRESLEEDTLCYAENIENAGKTLLSIINDILDLSKVEEGKMEIVPAQYNLSSLISDLVNMVRDRAEKKGLSLNVNTDRNTPHLLCGDEVRIRQCALNLLTNAVKYTERGSVTLEVGFEKLSEESISLIFRVSDTGIGMKKEDIERMFSPFARLEEMRNHHIEGTGLGLSITKKLLELMGSELKVSSVYGEGSVLSFAVEQQVIKWTPIEGYSAHYGGSGTARAAYRESFHAPDAHILVVDDMPVNLTLMKALLKKTQLKVDTAASGAEAITRASQQCYDMAFIDHMMPGMDGIETLQQLRLLPQTEKTVFIALTANAISGSREFYLEAGFTDYLSKPVDSKGLEKMLIDRLPPEKVLPVEHDAPADENAAEKAAPLLPEWLGTVEELDMRDGIRFCSTEESYLNILTVFANTVLSYTDEIEACRTQDDIAGVALRVHALKSTARIIGAKQLSAMAERMETASKAGDLGALDAELGDLLERLRALGHKLAPLIEKEKPSDDALPPLPGEKLRDIYGMARELLSALEYDRAAALLESLTHYRLPDGERERLDKLLEKADSFDWEELVSLLSETAS